jgi:hypothetical protein
MPWGASDNGNGPAEQLTSDQPAARQASALDAGRFNSSSGSGRPMRGALVADSSGPQDVP